jgi:RNA polymerase sigma-70 factor (ECF subfamily)
MTAQERDLLTLLRIYAGDTRALAELYDRHATLMHSVASAVLRNPADVEELVRDTWHRVWTRTALYEPRFGRVALWLVMLVRDRALERAHALHQPTEAEKLVLTTLRGPDMTAPLAESDAMAGALAREALARLTPLERRALAAALFERQSFEQIAERLEVPPASVRQWLRQGLDRLGDLAMQEQWS